MDDHIYEITLDSGGVITARSHNNKEKSKSVVTKERDSKCLRLLMDTIEDENNNTDYFKELGDELFQILIGDELDGHFQPALVEAHPNRLQLRLNLNKDHYIGKFRTAALPWEYLFHEPFGFFATNTAFTLSRFLSLNAPTERPLDLDNLPLRVLFVGAKPNDLGFIFADPANESAKEHLEDQISKDQVRIENLERPNRASLIAKIKEFRPHVLHFMGHGKFEEREGGAIALVDPENGKAIWISETETDALFRDPERKPRVVVLVACEGAKESVHAKVPSLAQAIVANNIEVVGMRFELKNKTGMAFTRAFYQALADGQQLDVATQSARTALYDADSVKTTRDFGGVVLYMRSAQGIIVPSNKTTPSEIRPSHKLPKLRIEDAIAAYKRHIDLDWRGGVDATGKVEVDKLGKPCGKWIELETHSDFIDASKQPE